MHSNVWCGRKDCTSKNWKLSFAYFLALVTLQFPGCLKQKVTDSKPLWDLGPPIKVSGKSSFFTSPCDPTLQTSPAFGSSPVTHSVTLRLSFILFIYLFIYSHVSKGIIGQLSIAMTMPFHSPEDSGKLGIPKAQDDIVYTKY